MMRRGFTLLEVNLAIFVMATGTLMMCILFSLGFREGRQSAEDVAAAACADTYLAPLVQGLSATNMTWANWQAIGDVPTRAETRKIADGVWPKDGWLAYAKQAGSSDGYEVKGDPRGTANGVFGRIVAKVPVKVGTPSGSVPKEYQYGLVVTRTGTRIQLAFRVARRKQQLMSQPVFVSEVRYQGDPSDAIGGTP